MTAKTNLDKEMILKKAVGLVNRVGTDKVSLKNCVQRQLFVIFIESFTIYIG